MKFKKVLDENVIFAASYAAGANSTQPATKHKRKRNPSLRQLEKELEQKQEELKKAKKNGNGERTISGLETAVKVLKAKVKEKQNKILSK